MRETYIQTSDLALASALLALGIPFCEDLPFVKARTQYGERFTFFFQEVSNCGKFHTMEMIHKWSDPQFLIDEIEHPLAYIKCSYIQKDALLDAVKQGLELVVIERNGKKAILSKNASPELQQKILGKL